MNMKYVLCVFEESNNYKISYVVYEDIEKAKDALKSWQVLKFGVGNRIVTLTDLYCHIQHDNFVSIAQIVELKKDTSYAVGALYRDDLYFFVDDFCDNEPTALDTMEDLATNHFTKKSMKEYNTQKLSQPQVIKGYGRNETFDAYFVIDLNSLA